MNRFPPVTSLFRLAAFAFLFSLPFCLTSCVDNVAYRAQLPPCAPVNGILPVTCSVQSVHSVFDSKPIDVPLAFIEFDDMGQAYKRGQMDAAEKIIQDKQKDGQLIVTILFIHGWKNNASDESNNVPGFRRFLQQVQAHLNYPVVGIYFAWRGNVTNLPVAQDLSYWSRRDTATYIPGSAMSEALFRVAVATKGADYNGDSRLIVVGHSFGGLVLERTVTEHLTRRIVENRGRKIKPFADLIVFVNEAAPATEGIQFLTMLKDRTIDRTIDKTDDQGDYPTIVSITSQGDLATKVILPVGQGASLLKKSVRDYGSPNDPDPFGIASQKTYYLRSATHIPQLQSHVVAKRADDVVSAYNSSYGYTCMSIPLAGGAQDYFVVRIGESKNTTPYWIMQMPVEIVPDHSNIFRLEFANLLEGLLIRQMKPKPSADRCYGEPDLSTVKIENMKSAISIK